MAGKIEIRASGAKFRFVVLNRSGEKLLQSGPFDDKPSAKRAASSLGKAIVGAEIVDATKVVAAAPKATVATPKARAAAPKAKAAAPKAKAAAPKARAAARRSAAKK